MKWVKFLFIQGNVQNKVQFHHRLPYIFLIWKITLLWYCKGCLTQWAEITLVFMLRLRVKQNLIKNEYQPFVNVWFESDKVNWFLRGGSGVISERSRSEIGCITVRRSQPSRSAMPLKLLFLYTVCLYYFCPR